MIDWVRCVLLASLGYIIYFIRLVIFPPGNFPRNIPTIPFYVVFVPVVTNWDQEQIFNVFFRDKMEKHGAVKMYFGSRWNILVSRPEYVAQILRNNDVFEKSGNFEKIPHAVVLHYLGDNVISTGNEKWKRYRKVVTNSILFPDLRPMDGHISDLMQNLRKEASKKGPLCAAGLLQRFFLASIGDCIMGCDLHTENGPNSIISRVRRLKSQIFRPFFMTFPVWDSFPIPSRKSARREVVKFKHLLRIKMLNERGAGNEDRLGPNLARAFEDGLLTQAQFEDNAIITLVAGHENPEMLLSTVLYLLAKHTKIQDTLRHQLLACDAGRKEELPFLNAVIFESLRLYPPIGQLVNRITRKNVYLGKDIFIPEGIYVGNNSFYTQRDRNFWIDADSFIPSRWGATEKEVLSNYNLAKSRCTLTAFHGRNRACLGEKFALTEVRRVLIAFLGEFDFTLDPEWRERVTPSGPIWPVQLSLNLKRIES